MNAGETTMSESAATRAEGRGFSGALLGMILFVTSEVMFFGALFGAYLAARGAATGRGEPWPPAGTELHLGLPIFLTVVLLTSSITVHKAMQRVKNGDLRGMERGLLVTIGLGLFFLGGQAVEYSLLDFSLGDHAFTTLFFMITGFHGLHVFIGVVILGVALITARRGRITPERHGHAEAAAFYWHFVDLVWIAVFVTLYLIR
jgi:cytochrome c oxidase subunit 3